VVTEVVVVVVDTNGTLHWPHIEGHTVRNAVKLAHSPAWLLAGTQMVSSSATWHCTNAVVVTSATVVTVLVIGPAVVRGVSHVPHRRGHASKNASLPSHKPWSAYCCLQSATLSAIEHWIPASVVVVVTVVMVVEVTVIVVVVVGVVVVKVVTVVEVDVDVDVDVEVDVDVDVEVVTVVLVEVDVDVDVVVDVVTVVVISSVVVGVGVSVVLVAVVLKHRPQRRGHAAQAGCVTVRLAQYWLRCGGAACCCGGCCCGGCCGGGCDGSGTCSSCSS
jgi:hypothetical protein